jgi:hypothetical protein
VGFLFLTWTDPQLAWTSDEFSEFSDIDKVTISADSIWTPDIELYNA